MSTVIAAIYTLGVVKMDLGASYNCYMAHSQ